MLKQSKRRLWLTSLMIIGFIFLLVSFRLIWMNYFKQEEQPLAVNGELDLRHWDWSEEKTIDLAGEWSFYPFELIESPEKHKQRNNKTTIQVPGDWSTTLTEDRSNPYGYGTYHLRI